MTPRRSLEVVQWQLVVPRFERKRAEQRQCQRGLPATPLRYLIGKPPSPNVKCHIPDTLSPGPSSSGRSVGCGELLEPTIKRPTLKAGWQGGADSVQGCGASPESNVGKRQSPS